MCRSNVGALSGRTLLRCHGARGSESHASHPVQASLKKLRRQSIGGVAARVAIALPLCTHRTSVSFEKEVCMLTNATYVLLATASVNSKGLNRYDQFFGDGHDCQV